MLGAALAVTRAVVATDAAEAEMRLERLEAEIADRAGLLDVDAVFGAGRPPGSTCIAK